MAESGRTIEVLIASPLEAEHVQRIVDVDPRLRVTYRADLLAQPRYPADHHPKINRTVEQAAEWAALLARAEVMFDVDQPSADGLLKRAPRLRWIQSSSSGVGEWARRLGLVESPIVVTNAAGIHARPLAEFVLFAMLYFAKRWPRMVAEQRAHRWERCAIETLNGKTLGIVGLGRVGQEIARLARPLGMNIIGTRNTGAPIDGVDRVFAPRELNAVLQESDYLVLIVPLTTDTRTLIGAGQLRQMKDSAVLINIARGAVVDESALIEALSRGQLAGAALDVVAHEPLAPDSPLWEMSNVLITPHSMSTALEENARLTDLFCENLRRYLASEPLLNQIDKVRGY